MDTHIIYREAENALSLGCERSGTKLTIEAPGSAIYTLCNAESGASILR